MTVSKNDGQTPTDAPNDWSSDPGVESEAFDGSAPLMPDAQTIESYDANARIRGGRWLELLRPSRVAIVVVEVLALSATRAKALLEEDNWSLDDQIPGSSLDGDETSLVARKEVHSVFPFDLDDDVHARIRFLLSRGKVDPIAITVDISQSVPALHWRQWRPEPVGGEADTGNFFERVGLWNRSRSYDLNPEPHVENRSGETNSDSKSMPNRESSIERSTVGRRLRWTKVYTSSSDSVEAKKIWGRHSSLLGLPEEVPLTKTGPREREGRRGTRRKEFWRSATLAGLMLVSSLAGIFLGSRLERSWLSIWVPLTIVFVVAGLLFVGSRRNLSTFSSELESGRPMSVWTACVMGSGCQLLLGLLLGYNLAGLTNSVWTTLAILVPAAMCTYALGLILRHFPIRGQLFRSVLRLGFFVAAYTLWARMTFHEFYASLGIRTGNVDFVVVDMIRALWKPTLEAVLLAALAGIIWIVFYRNRYGEPFNWYLAMVCVLTAVLPLMRATDDAYAAGQIIGSGTSYQYKGYEATPMWVLPATPFSSLTLEGVQSSEETWAESGAEDASRQKPILMWRIGTTTMQTLFLSLLHPEFTGCATDSTAGHDVLAPVVVIPTASIVMKLAELPKADCPYFG